MLRWDACAPGMVKHLLSSGRPEWNQKMLDWFIVDDPRAFDILYEFPNQTITVWRRPWVRVALLDGYPVEYRVFVHDGTVRGVSNYYVQRPLALNGQPCDGIFDDVRKVIAKASALSEALPAPLRYGPAAKYFPADQRSFTADFMRLDAGELTFLGRRPAVRRRSAPVLLPGRHPPLGARCGLGLRRDPGGPGGRRPGIGAREGEKNSLGVYGDNSATGATGSSQDFSCCLPKTPAPITPK